MELSDFIGVIRKWKWIVIMVVLSVTIYTVITSLQGQNSYRAETIVVVGLSGLTSPGSAGVNLALSGPKIGATYAELVTTEPVISRALEIAGLDWQPSALSGRVETDIPKETSVIKIAVTDRDAARAILLTDAVANSFIEYIKDVSATSFENSKDILKTELAKAEEELATASVEGANTSDSEIRALQQTRDALLRRYDDILDEQVTAGDIRVIQPASAYQTVGIQASQRIIIGFAISLVIGIGVAFIAEAISKSLKKQ